MPPTRNEITLILKNWKCPRREWQFEKLTVASFGIDLNLMRDHEASARRESYIFQFAFGLSIGITSRRCFDIVNNSDGKDGRNCRSTERQIRANPESRQSDIFMERADQLACPSFKSESQLDIANFLACHHPFFVTRDNCLAPLTAPLPETVRPVTVIPLYTSETRVMHASRRSGSATSAGVKKHSTFSEVSLKKRTISDAHVHGHVYHVKAVRGLSAALAKTFRRPLPPRPPPSAPAAAPRSRYIYLGVYISGNGGFGNACVAFLLLYLLGLPSAYRADAFHRGIWRPGNNSPPRGDPR